MYWNVLDDGRQVIVDTSQQQTRQVGDEEFFLDPAYVNVLLDGKWQYVKKSRLGKVVSADNPFGPMRGPINAKK